MLFDIPSIIKKLIGNVVPVGETEQDDERYENLKELKYVLDSTITSMLEVSDYRNCPEFSRKRAGEKAYKDLINLRDTLCAELGYPNKE